MIFAPAFWENKNKSYATLQSLAKQKPIGGRRGEALKIRRDVKLCACCHGKKVLNGCLAMVAK